MIFFLLKLNVKTARKNLKMQRETERRKKIKIAFEEY